VSPDEEFGNNLSTPPIPTEAVTAILELRAAVAANPDDARAHFYLAQWLMERAAAIAGERRTPGEAREPIELLRRTITLTADHPIEDRAIVHAELAGLLCWRWRIGAELDQADRDEIVQNWRRAVDLAGEAGIGDELCGDYAPVALDVIELLIANTPADLADLTIAVDSGDRIRASMAADDDEDRWWLLYLLGMAHAIRYDLARDVWPQDRTDAIECLSELRAALPDDHPGCAEVALWLGLVLADDAFSSSTVSGSKIGAAAAQLEFALRALPDRDAGLAALARFRLGAMRAFGYQYAGAGAQVRRSALTDLTALLEPGTRPELTNSCHFLIAELHLTESWPPRLRLAETILADLHDSPELLPSEETIELVLGHLNAITMDGAGDRSESWTRSARSSPVLVGCPEIHCLR
jgi:tetratricopeptide (TPR) repeat protein